jgi:hypothetical protein
MSPALTRREGEWRIPVAEGVGFEPTKRGNRLHAFQACALGQTVRSLLVS